MAMHFPTTHGQRGAVLIISLVLLMVLTILAISTMRTASLGLLMAGNTQYRQNAWQLAQAGIDSILRAGDPALTDSCDTAVADAPVAIGTLGGSYTTTVCYRGESITPGNSITRVPTFNFEVQSEGTTEQRGARARLVQGFAVTGASGR
jgi:type IV pilus assembly protein PilX